MSTDPSDAERFEKAQQEKAIAQIANVSRLLRNAIESALPVAPEQYMTVAIPGEVIDIRPADDGGTLIFGKEEPFTPTEVRQAEARLVDKMLPLANVMIGNTGKSVARSYSRALDALVPKKALIANGTTDIRSPGEESYEKAMTYLTTVDPETKKTPIDIYVEKQKAWANAQTAWDTAKIDAKHAAEKDPANIRDLDKKPDPKKILQAYNDWTQSNYRKYKFAVQGAWMDWVANGHKYNVEYYFGVVDVDSIMARIENSKESMRNSTMVDADGSNELHGVLLTPPDWATYCKNKADGWYERNEGYTLEQLEAEIARLKRLRISYETANGLTSLPSPEFPISAPQAPDSTGKDEAAVTTKYTDLYKAMAKVNMFRERERNGQDMHQSGDAATDTPEKALEAFAKAQGLLGKTVKENQDYEAAQAKYTLASLNDGSAKQAMEKWFVSQLKTIDDNIRDLEVKRSRKLDKTVSVPIIIDSKAKKTAGGAADDYQDGSVEVAGPGAENAGDMFKDPPPPGAKAPPADPWVTITASFSATDQKSTSETKSWGMSVGAGAGWGLWSAGGSYAHDETSGSSTNDMSNCDVSVSFSAMVVNIDRPWLYGELFNDFELEVADGVNLSPGARELKALMSAQGELGADKQPTAKARESLNNLANYSQFPAYPTSFIIAADTSIEFTGNTAHIEDHFSSHSNSGGVSVGWGPFSVSSSFHESASKQSHQMQTTATGCRLTFGAPQIIAWVSQILPQLPRPKEFQPMIQNNVPALVGS